jgi:hypothetical protein
MPLTGSVSVTVTPEERAPSTVLRQAGSLTNRQMA